MNKKLKKMAEESGISFINNSDDQILKATITEADLDKFVKIILKDCYTVIKNVKVTDCSRNEYIEAIQNNFKGKK